MPDYRISTACETDRQAILAMHAQALRRLSGGKYTREQIEALIGYGTLDDVVFGRDRYFVVTFGRSIVASGGWTSRRPRYADRLGTDDSHDGVPIVRAVYVHPDWARRGLGRMIMGHIERDIAGAGFDSVRLTATLCAVAMYRSLGYGLGAVEQLTLPCGTRLACVAMSRSLPADARSAA